MILKFASVCAIGAIVLMMAFWPIYCSYEWA